MQIELTPEQCDLIRRAIHDGRVKSEDEALRQALDLWIKHEREHEAILTTIDAAEASLASDKGIAITKRSMRELAEDVKRRGRERVVGGTKPAR